MPKLKLEDSDLSPIVASTIYQLGLPSTNAMKSLCHVSLWPLDWIRSLSPSKLWRKPSWPSHIMVSKACYATQIYSLIQKPWPADWNTGYIKSALIHLHWALSIDCWQRESFAINIDQCTAVVRFVPERDQLPTQYESWPSTICWCSWLYPIQPLNMFQIGDAGN